MDETSSKERKALRRLVVLLSALADLAERAGGRSGSIGSLVLWLLGYAEAVARDYVCAVTASANGRIPAVAFPGDGAAALRLAASFRTLAAALRAFIAALPVRPCGNFAAATTLNMLVLAMLAGPRPAVVRLDSS